MSRQEVRSNQTVVVRGGRITQVGPVEEVTVPEDALRVEAHDKFLMPGLMDMHVHISSEPELSLYIAYGVTTVRDLFGSHEQLAMRVKVAVGDLLGPRMYVAGAHLEAGFDYLKVLSGLSDAAYRGLVAEAKSHGLPVAGHVPPAVGLAGVLNARQDSIEHLDGFWYEVLTEKLPFDSWEGLTLPGLWYERPAEIAELLAQGVVAEAELVDQDHLSRLVIATKNAGTWVVPTLIAGERGYLPLEAKRELQALPIMRWVDPQYVDQWMRAAEFLSQWTGEAEYRLDFLRNVHARIVDALDEGGVPILVGTDAPNPFVVPGFAVHEELQRLVEAGLTPFDALSAATRRAAEFLGVLDVVGTVEPGKQADLLLLEANPLEDISSTQKIAGVMVACQYGLHHLRPRARRTALEVLTKRG